MFKRLVFLIVFAASAASVANAEDIIELSPPAEIRARQDALKRDLTAKKGAYDHLSNDEKQKILRKQEMVYALIEGKDSIESMSEEDKLRLVNMLGEVRALVTKAEDERLICERVKKLGSNRPENKCLTVAQRRYLREKVQREGLDPAK